MIDYRDIRDREISAASKARKNKIVPYQVSQEEIDHWRRGVIPGFPFPVIGSYQPGGYRLLRELFVDASGFGRDDEPALSTQQFIAELQAGKCYAVTSAGQFQVYVGEFEKRGKK